MQDAMNKWNNKRPDEGFTLVELLVVIGIIAVLVGILLPVLGSARESARKAKCLSNGRSIGQAMMAYLVSSQGTYPSAYFYNGMTYQQGVANSEAPTTAVNGYVHWS